MPGLRFHQMIAAKSFPILANAAAGR